MKILSYSCKINIGNPPPSLILKLHRIENRISNMYYFRDVLLTYTEENYLKSIYHLSTKNSLGETSTNGIAEFLTIKPATVTSMLKKLREKDLILYERYGKVTLTQQGNSLALQIIRKHRLWEVFLVDKLQFEWDEVHEVAEQLEHIRSQKLIDKLDDFLNHPSHDPHGDPIPNNDGFLKNVKRISLTEANLGKTYQVIAVNDSSSDLLQYLLQLRITLSTSITVVRKIEFDQSLQIIVHNQEINVSEKFAQHIFIQ